jgi:hypothetical protein
MNATTAFDCHWAKIEILIGRKNLFVVVSTLFRAIGVAI